MVVEESSDRLHQLPTLFPSLYENDNDMLYSRTVREIQIASNFAVLKSSSQPVIHETSAKTLPNSNKRCKLDSSSSPSSIAVTTTPRANAMSTKEQKQYQLALETAVLVQKEIEQWENSIRELEAMLLLRQEPEKVSHQTSSVESSPLTVTSTTSVGPGTVAVLGESSNNEKVKQVEVVIIPNAVSLPTDAAISLIDEDDDDDPDKAVFETDAAEKSSSFQLSSITVVTKQQ